jgi:predicted dienelactone hydrolase
MTFARSLLVCAAVTHVLPAFAQTAPGLLETQIIAPHHGRSMGIALWYPADAGPIETFAENPVFEGGPVRRDAKPTAGKHPVVLLSHGMGGSYLALNWLASGLAKRGAIVVGVDHPNGWFGDRQIDKMFNHWTRAWDLRVALDHVLADPAMKSFIDPDRVFAIGFSFGGWTALSLGGATASRTGNHAYCHGAGARSHTCTDLSHFGLSEANSSTPLWTASHKDPRVKAVVAIDPGLTWDMTKDDVRDLDQKTLMVIGLGTGADQHYATDTTENGSNFDRLVPLAKKVVLAPATHFTAMPICKPAGAAILAAERDDPVCTDPAGTDRAAAHRRMIDLAAEQFGLPDRSPHDH